MTETPAFKILVYMLPAIVGSFVSLRFLPEGVGKLNKLSSFCSSLGIAHFIGRGIAEHYGFIESVESMVIATTGMVGLTVVSHVINEIPKTIKAFRVKYFEAKK